MNIESHIIRSVDNDVQTTGKWYITGSVQFACDTLERTYKDNQRKVSCIPSGTFFYKKVLSSPAIPYPHLLILNVPGRDGICVHSGNLYTHSLGCILVGIGYSDINKDGQVDILRSKETLKKLLAFLPEEGTIKITEAQKKPIKSIII